MIPGSTRSYGGQGLAMSKRKYYADKVEYIRSTNAASCYIIHRYLGIMEVKDCIGYSGLQALGKSVTVLSRRKIFQRHTYAPPGSYYTIEFPQDSHAGRRERAAAWCQPEGTLVLGKENPLSATTVRSPCKRSQSQMAVLAWATP